MVVPTGKYTISDDPRVDTQIEARLGRIVQTLVRGIPNIESIILTGGFGKGEGSFKVCNTTVRPLRDFDLIVILSKHANLRRSVRAARQLNLGGIGALTEYKYGTEFSVDVHVTTLDHMNLYPDIVTFDSKKSHVIFGTDLRNEIRWKATDIPLRTGARLLFQKSTALIGGLSYEYVCQQDIPTSLKEVFLRETSKVYVEIGAALCILTNTYDAHASKRVNILRHIYRREFRQLFEVIPDLVDSMDSSTKYKLDPVSNPINQDPTDYWFKTRDVLGEVMKHYFKRYLGLSFSDWITYSRLLNRGLARNYYVPLIENYLRTRKMPSNEQAVALLNLLYNLKESFDQMIAHHDKYGPSLILTKGSPSPAIRVFSVCPLIMFGINRDASINHSLVDEALKQLDFVKLGTHPGNPWEEARLKCVKMVNILSFL